jgi:hypothetical protein
MALGEAVHGNDEDIAESLRSFEARQMQMGLRLRDASEYVLKLRT